MAEQKDFTPDATEIFWVGPKHPWRHVVHKMNASATEQMWFQAGDGTRLEPDHSEFSIRIHDPSMRSLSFINRTIAIIPKSRLRTIYNLIGGYLEAIEKTET